MNLIQQSLSRAPEIYRATAPYISGFVTHGRLTPTILETAVNSIIFRSTHALIFSLQVVPSKEKIITFHGSGRNPLIGKDQTSAARGYPRISQTMS